jgi:hypothetical protein
MLNTRISINPLPDPFSRFRSRRGAIRNFSLRSDDTGAPADAAIPNRGGLV